MRTVVVCLLALIILSACKKKSDCGNIANYYSRYALTDLIYKSDGMSSVLADTINVHELSSTGKSIMDDFSAGNEFMTLSGCSENFKVDTVVFGTGTFSGNGTFNGSSIQLTIRFVSSPFTSNHDTLLYQCSGYKIN